jgi:heat shock protein HslJ
VRYVARMLQLITLGLAVLIGGCSGGSKGISLAALAGDEWGLVRWTADGTPVVLAPGAKVTFAVTPDGNVSGSASVNRYIGKMTLTDAGKVRWGGGFATTRMAGPPPLMDQETRYLAALAKVDHASLDGRKLTLSGPAVVLDYER